MKPKLGPPRSPHLQLSRCHICHDTGTRTVLVAGNYGLCACLCRKPKEATAHFQGGTKLNLKFFPVELYSVKIDRATK